MQIAKYKIKHTKCWWIFSILLAGFMTYTAGHAQDRDTQTVTATGIGAIVAGDRAKARDDAIENALRNAVEQVVGVMITSETRVENFQVLSDKIYSQTKGYVQGYDIVRGSEKIQPDAVELTIEAVVKLGDLERDLAGIAFLLRGLKRPRIMVLIEEQNLIVDPKGERFFSTNANTAEATLTEAFLEKGFDLVDQATVRQNIARDQALAAARGDAVAAATLGQQFDAEVVITGRAMASETPLAPELAKRLGGMKSGQANVTATAIRVDTGAIMAQAGPNQQAKVHINPIMAGTQAIQEATAGLADELMRKILIRWQAERGGTTLVRVLVHKVRFVQLLDLERKLKSHIRGVKEVFRREFTNNEAVLDVEIEGNADFLAAELAVKDLETLTVNITGVSQNRVELQVESK